MGMTRYLCVPLLTLVLTACSSNPPAPVVDRLPASKASVTNKSDATNSLKKPSASRPTYKTGDWRPDTYTVKKGDTLFSIGLEHGYDYKEIAQANNIAAPYNIKVGQSLKFNTLKDKPASAENKPAQENSDGVIITPINTEPSVTSTSATNTSSKSVTPTTPAVIAIAEPKAIREAYSEEALKKPLPAAAKPAVEKPAAVTPATKPVAAIQPNTANKPGDEAKPEPKPEAKSSTDSAEDMDWAWPTKGKVVASFNESSNKGIDIAGSSGQAVNAAAMGKVIYSGSDLRGYGKLVIIKHNANYLSVYAHNSLILVKEGQQVSRGQKIAEMGNTDSNTVKLHFEIRRQGKSVDPGKYLTTTN